MTLPKYMSFKHTLIAAAIMILTMLILRFLSQPEETHPNKPFSTFPTSIGEWNGQHTIFDEKTVSVVGVDDYVLCNYHASDKRQVQLYVGFYQSQRQGDLIHSPKNCLPGSGWRILETSIEEITTLSGKMKVIRLLTVKNDQKQIVLYWFQSQGRIISSEYMQKIFLVIDAITRFRTDGSFVRLSAPVQKNEPETLKYMIDFIRLIMPILNEYIPA